MLWVLVPASGSVIANAIVPVPSQMPGQPAPLLLLGAVAADDRAADRRAHDHQQQRAALRGELLADRRDVADAAATAAVLLGDVDAEVAVPADLQPQVGGLLAGAGLLGEPLAAVLPGQLGDLAAQRLALLGLGERCVMLSPRSRRSSLSRPRPAPRPAATCAPGSDGSSVTVPACGAADGVLHLHRLEHQHRLAGRDRASPFATATRTTVPGIGASRLPLATASAGSMNRGTTVSATCPVGESTSTRSPVTATSYVVRDAVALEVTPVGRAATDA